MERVLIGGLLVCLTGCGAGLGAIRARIDAKPAVAVVQGGHDMHLFKMGIPDDSKGGKASLPDDYKAIPEAIAEELQASFPDVKVGGEDARAGADLLVKVEYLTGYHVEEDEKGATFKNVHFRVEAYMEWWDAKANKKLSGPTPIGIIDDGYGVGTKILPGDEHPSSATLEQMQAKRPSQQHVAALKTKVVDEVKGWLADLKKAKPAK
jgi:hypothetical protein